MSNTKTKVAFQGTPEQEAQFEGIYCCVQGRKGCGYANPAKSAGNLRLPAGRSSDDDLRGNRDSAFRAVWHLDLLFTVFHSTPRDSTR